MAEYRKINWKVHKEGGQLYIRESVARKPKFEEDPRIEHGRAGQAELNREKRRNKEFAQEMNHRYIGFLMVSAAVVFASAAVYLSQISSTNTVKDEIEAMESQLEGMKLENDETQSRMEAGVNPEKIRQTAIDELGMVYAGKEQIIRYQYEESDYVRQYEDIPGK